MIVITFASRKGGAGKTTLLTHLAVAAEAAGDGPVGVVDCDQMQGLARWYDARGAESPILARPDHGLAAALDALREAGCRVAMVDTPPSIGAEVLEAVRAADLVVVPCQPSPNDLRAVGATVEAIRVCRKAMVFTVNRVKPRSRLTLDTAVALSQHGTVAPVQVGDRTDYAAAMIDGLVASEIGSKQAADEMAALWTYILGRLEVGDVVAA